MNSRAVAVNGVGYGSRAMATHGYWWVAEVVANLPKETAEVLFAPLSGTTVVDAGETIINLVQEAGLSSLVNDLTSIRPPIELKSKVGDTVTIRTRTNMSASEIIKTTTAAIIRLVSIPEGD